MSTQCEICPDVIYKEENGTFFDQNRVVTSPGYWEYQFTTKSTSFEESMLNQYLDMLSKDSTGFTVCNNCKTMLESDPKIAKDLGIEDYVTSMPDGKVDLNSAGIVLGSVWKKLHGSWPSTIKVKNFNSNIKIGTPASQQPEKKKEEPKKEQVKTSPSSKKIVDGRDSELQPEDEKNTPLILDSVVKKAEEGGWANILQKQIKEFEKKNNEQEKLIKELKSKFDEYDKRIKNLTTPTQGKFAKIAPVLTLILFFFFIMTTIYLNNKIDNQQGTHAGDTVAVNSEVQKNHPDDNQQGTRTLDNSEGSTKVQDIHSTDETNTIPDNGPKKKNGTNLLPTPPKDVIKVPSLIGLETSTARIKLMSSGLKATIISVSFGEENVGKVVKQKPAAGNKVKKGTPVILQVGE